MDEQNREHPYNGCTFSDKKNGERIHDKGTQGNFMG